MANNNNRHMDMKEMMEWMRITWKTELRLPLEKQNLNNQDNIRESKAARNNRSLRRTAATTPIPIPKHAIATITTTWTTQTRRARQQQQQQQLVELEQQRADNLRITIITTVIRSRRTTVLQQTMPRVSSHLKCSLAKKRLHSCSTSCDAQRNRVKWCEFSRIPKNSLISLKL